MRVEKSREASSAMEARMSQEQECCSTLESCDQSCPEGYGTYKYDANGNSNDYSCSILPCCDLPCCDPTYTWPCNDPNYCDTVRRDCEQYDAPCNDPEYCGGICGSISSILSYCWEGICSLLVTLGLSSNDEQKVRDFISWSTDIPVTVELTRLWIDRFEALPENARRFSMRSFVEAHTAEMHFSFKQDKTEHEVYTAIQQKLSEEGHFFSEAYDAVINRALVELMATYPREITGSLSSWADSAPDQRRETPVIITKEEFVAGFVRRWGTPIDPSRLIPQPLPPKPLDGCSWQECFAALPQQAKDFAREMFQRYPPEDNPGLCKGIDTFARIRPLDEDSEEGRRQLTQNRRAGEALDALIYARVADKWVITALSSWEEPKPLKRVLKQEQQ